MRTFYIVLSLIATAILSPSVSAQWSNISPPEIIHHMRSISFVDEMTGCAAGWISISSGTGGVQSVVSRTTDGGATWQSVTINKVEINAIHFVDADNGFAAGAGYDCGCAVLLRSTDGGRTWATQEYTGLVGSFQAIDFFDARNGIVGGGDIETDNGYVMRTTDGGVSFIRVFEREAAYVSRLDQVSPGLAYLAAGAEEGAENTIYKTVNLGAGVGTIEWNAVKTFDGFVSISGLDFVSEETGYAVMTAFDGGGYRGEIHRTTDGGTEWSEAFGTGAFTLIALDFLDADNGLAVGENATIVQTSDGGFEWSENATHETDLLTWVQFVTPGIAYAVGTDGTVLKYDRSAAVPGESEPGPDDVRVEITPNPLVATATVQVRGGIEGDDYRMILTDARGSEVATIQLSGGHGEFQRSDLPSGSYFYRLLQNGSTITTGSMFVR